MSLRAGNHQRSPSSSNYMSPSSNADPSSKYMAYQRVKLIASPWITGKVLDAFSTVQQDVQYIQPHFGSAAATLRRLNLSCIADILDSDDKEQQLRHPFKTADDTALLRPESEGANKMTDSQSCLTELPNNNLIDFQDFELRAQRCRETIKNLEDSSSSAVDVPIQELVGTKERREEEFFATALRYLLPYQVNAIDPVLRLICEINARYFELPYHNCAHAALVTHHSIELAKMCGLWQPLNRLDKLAFVCAALGHDLGHPGLNNEFFARTMHPLSRIYNELSTLENYHAASLLRLLCREDCDLFRGHVSSIKQQLRQLIVQSILWTDLSNHYQICEQISATLQGIGRRRGASLVEVPQFKRSSLAFCLKVGDLGYMAMQPASYAIQRAIDFHRELYTQTAILQEFETSAAMSVFDLADPDVPSPPLGMPAWYDSNSKFGMDLVMPMGRLLAEIERKLRKKPENVAAKAAAENNPPPQLQPLGPASYQVDIVKGLNAKSVKQLLESLSNLESPDPAKREEVLRAINANKKLLPQTSQQASRGSLISYLGKLSTPLETRESKIQKSNIWRCFAIPLERNVDILRKAKYITPDRKKSSNLN